MARINPRIKLNVIQAAPTDNKAIECAVDGKARCYSFSEIFLDHAAANSSAGFPLILT